jgi:hypothetical protein
VQADGGASLPGSQLDQVAHLIHHPQSVTALAGGPAPLPGQRVGDPSVVLYLAQDFLLGVA